MQHILHSFQSLENNLTEPSRQLSIADPYIADDVTNTAHKVNLVFSNKSRLGETRKESDDPLNSSLDS